MTNALPGGNLTLAGDLTISRMGYGAMQLAGPGASAVLPEAVLR
jgi:pyridoxine 4-dehydrogenase